MSRMWIFPSEALFLFHKVFLCSLERVDNICIRFLQNWWLSTYPMHMLFQMIFDTWLFPWLLWAVLVANLPYKQIYEGNLKKYVKLLFFIIEGSFSSLKLEKSIKTILKALHRLLHVRKALQRWYYWTQGGGLFAVDRFVWKNPTKILSS